MTLSKLLSLEDGLLFDKSLDHKYSETTSLIVLFKKL